jgi:hypothetical protein
MRIYRNLPSTPHGPPAIVTAKRGFFHAAVHSCFFVCLNGRSLRVGQARFSAALWKSPAAAAGLHQQKFDAVAVDSVAHRGNLFALAQPAQMRYAKKLNWCRLASKPRHHCQTRIPSAHRYRLRDSRRLCLEHSMVRAVRRLFPTSIHNPESFYPLAFVGRRRQYSVGYICKQEGALGTLALSALQSRTDDGTQIRCRLYVHADRRNQAAAKIDGAADLFLSAMLGVFGHGPCTRRRAQSCRLADDSRVSGGRSRAGRGCVGKPARNSRPASSHRNRWRLSALGQRWILRILITAGRSLSDKKACLSSLLSSSTNFRIIPGPIITKVTDSDQRNVN